MTNRVAATMTLRGEQINGDRVCCTGNQLAAVLHALDAVLQDEQWYAADIAVNQRFPWASLSSQNQAAHIGNIENLARFATQIDQFLSGIFLAVPSYISPIWNRSFDTEDEPTHDLGDAILEIRAFDTSYFELYTSNPQIFDLLRASFEAAETTVA
ncbi:MAG: hypothetical protein F6K09_03195 [Merismopedia sp. SIO2A8]|nr:hypothetical protein [Merismopedia sp. SIO2A8]